MDGKRLKRLRESLGLTQEQMAERLQTTRTTIGRWEVGMAKPRGLYQKALESLIREVEASSKRERRQKK